MSYISTMSSKGAGLAKQNRFYDDWSSGNHAVNNALLYRERVKSENRRLKLTVRDDVANALRQSTVRMAPPEPSYRSAGSTARSTGRSVLSTGRRRLEGEDEVEAHRLAQQMVEAQRELELQRVIEEEQESTKALEAKFEKITAYLQAQQAAEAQRRRQEEAAGRGRQETFERPVRFKERKKQAYKVLVPDPLHGRTRLITARLSGSEQLITERGIRRQHDFLRKQQNLPRVLPRRTISEDAVTMSQNPKIQYERKKW